MCQRTPIGRALCLRSKGMGIQVPPLAIRAEKDSPWEHGRVRKLESRCRAQGWVNSLNLADQDAEVVANAKASRLHRGAG